MDKSPDLQLQFFFPTVIGHSYHDKLRDKLLPVVKKVLADDSLLTNEWGYKNTYNGSNGLQNRPEFAELASFLKQQSYNYLTTLGYESRDEMFPNIFVSEMQNGDYHDRHCHPGATVSGVFYLDIPPDSANILFYDPRNFRDARSTVTKKQTNDITSDMAVFAPTNGMLLIWESWMHHQVDINKSKEGRITIVFNA